MMYGKTFQESVIHALLTDERWAVQFLEVFTPELFEYTHLQYIAKKVGEYFEQYASVPSYEALVVMMRDDLRMSGDDLLRKKVIDFVTRMKQADVSDLPFVKDKALDFCRRQQVRRALERIVERIDEADYDELLNEFAVAVNKGTVDGVGHDFRADREERFMQHDRRPIPTGIEPLDSNIVLRGGLGRGELGVWVAPTGVGKSHALVHVGATALMRGLNVIHYTLELSEHAIGLRYDSHITDIPVNDLYACKEEVERIEDNLDLGTLIIKGYPTGTASVNTLRAHIEKCILRGVKPDLVIIDYADIMRSSRKYDSLRFELKLIYEEVRGLAEMFQVPIWTASQANREASSAQLVDLTNMSEAYAKAMVSDVVIGISRRPEEKALGTCRLFVAKNRAGKDGICYDAKLDTGRSRITPTSNDPEGQSPEEVAQIDESYLADALRRKWNEYTNDGRQATAVALNSIVAG